ncbi:MAG TPA: DUF3331 domain-containing protein, partial [Paraburkholderia sp.]|nr:DUF3331 domain-containing protein [Paraburkholderia sp.]
MWVKNEDPWARIVGSLAGDHGEERPEAEPLAHAWVYRFASPKERSNVTVKLVDCARDDRVILTWIDSTKCCYLDQIWRRVRARFSGYCVLSGAQIRRGDMVFRPSVGRMCLVNGDAMILGSELR